MITITHKSDGIVTSRIRAVVGIDPSTKSGLSVLDIESGEELETVNLKQATDRTRNKVKQKRNPYDRLQAAITQLEEVLDRYEVEVCCLEGYGFNLHGKVKQSVDSIIVQCRFGEAIRHVLWRRGIRWYEAKPSQLKQFCLGKGVGGKDEIRLGLYKKWRKEFKTDDECDAYVLARMALGFADPNCFVSTKYEQDVLDKVFNADYNQALNATINFD
ncbi:crossover junction endodeoxyribonuclease RuvC (plasmid) [Halobacteriovorax sp. GFR7]|uniref:crossover junction endodeoxyribonuclease RuvC n=1 Tax=unclassified Halobacteriovorax TaxID=2639665 RepID=UPI003D99F9CA